MEDTTLVFEEEVDDRLLDGGSKRAVIKKKTKSLWASSRGKISIVWFLALTIIAAMYILIIPRQDDERALEIAFLVSTVIGKWCVCV